jgi:hypothetical protein
MDKNELLDQLEEISNILRMKSNSNPLLDDLDAIADELQEICEQVELDGVTEV